MYIANHVLQFSHIYIQDIHYLWSCSGMDDQIPPLDIGDVAMILEDIKSPPHSPLTPPEVVTNAELSSLPQPLTQTVPW